MLSIFKIDIDGIEGERFPFVFFLKMKIVFIILDCQKSVQPFYFVCISLKNDNWCNGKNAAGAVFAFLRELTVMTDSITVEGGTLARTWLTLTFLTNF